ncbi:hypothetical protein AINA4_10600 [Aurantimicrobium sp. INA4]|nr:hypothetical protein AINA4_10600 [Aurantimicrobium sp. INA4]
MKEQSVRKFSIIIEEEDVLPAHLPCSGITACRNPHIFWKGYCSDTPGEEFGTPSVTDHHHIQLNESLGEHTVNSTVELRRPFTHREHHDAHLWSGADVRATKQP